MYICTYEHTYMYVYYIMFIRICNAGWPAILHNSYIMLAWGYFVLVTKVKAAVFVMKHRIPLNTVLDIVSYG